MTATPTSTDVTIGGTPTAFFSGTVIVTAIDANGCRTNAGYALNIVCPPPPPQLFIMAPSTVIAGTPNWTASVPSHAGSTYAWAITNGTITAGQGTSQIVFTAGTAGTPLTLTVTETLSSGCIGGGGIATLTVVPAPSATKFYTVTPCRQLDTRTGPGTPLAASSTLTVPLTGTPCGIPSSATAVSVNMTVTQQTADGSLTVYPSDGTLPNTTSIEFKVGPSRANNAILLLSTDGNESVDVYNNSAGTVHVILDVNGYFQ